MDKFRHDIWKPAQVIVNSFMAHIVGDICSNSQSIQKCCQHCNRKFSLLGNSAFFFMISWLQAKIKNFIKKLSKSWKKKYITWIKSLLLIVHCFFLKVELLAIPIARYLNVGIIIYVLCHSSV